MSAVVACPVPGDDWRGLPRGTILKGDALTTLTTLPGGSVDCVVTSPPYFRLRDYDVSGQLGLEAHVEAWARQLLDVTSELKRVLVPTGTLWLNLGDSYSTHPREGAPAKSLVAAPERVLLGLLAQGWTLRNKIVWAKANPMPTSVSDRLSCTHETIYLLAPSPRYFFDLDAIRVPLRSPVSTRPRGRRTTTRTDSRRPAWLGPNADRGAGLADLHARGLTGHPLGKNPGDVWRIATSRYRGAHFATYPEALVERMLLAGCPERRCVRCHAPWRRPIRRLGVLATRLALQPTCECNSGSELGVVLDPFMGSGTTAVVAERLARDWLGIELNPNYVTQAWARINEARRAARDGPGAMHGSGADGSDDAPDNTNEKDDNCNNHTERR